MQTVEEFRTYVVVVVLLPILKTARGVGLSPTADDPDSSDTLKFEYVSPQPNGKRAGENRPSVG
jgi:hypothetical protein